MFDLSTLCQVVDIKSRSISPENYTGVNQAQIEHVDDGQLGQAGDQRLALQGLLMAGVRHTRDSRCFMPGNACNRFRDIIYLHYHFPHDRITDGKEISSS